MPQTKKPKMKHDPVIVMEHLTTIASVEKARAALNERAAELNARDFAAKYKPKRGEKLKLFVWDPALSDHSSGIAFAFAYNADHARALVVQAVGDTSSLRADLKREPQVCEKPEGFGCHGGG